jgi:hypothetical protein|eukprot:scaffold2091_cov187-Chaetoceros_neogracile.AAC.5
MSRTKSKGASKTSHDLKKKAFQLMGCAVLAEALDADEEDVLEDMYRRRSMEISQLRKRSARHRKFRRRQSWRSFQDKLTDRQFRRYFRMERGCFKLLCERIEENIGRSAFKSESYIRDLRCGRIANKGKYKMDFAQRKSTGGFISGEVKLALTLRLLAGGTYMDLALLYETGFTYSYTIFKDVVNNWINDNRLVNINGKDFLEDEEKMKEAVLEFARHSNGLFVGAIGALDGWLVKIGKPRRRSDKVQNPGSYFSRKGFFAVNVQVIVDKKKRVWYRAVQCRGAEHDSTAFKHSSIYKLLQEKWKGLLKKGYYIIGDSAYALRSYLMTPFDNAMHGTDECNFNFFHSSSRITVECAFGEIDMRWGILWKPLRFKLKQNIQIIDACLRLHNFIVDYREAQKQPTALDELERTVFGNDCARFYAVNPRLEHYGIVGGEDEIRRNAEGAEIDGRGRPFADETDSRDSGIQLRNDLRDEIKRRGYDRPRINWFRGENNRTLNTIY